jgi:predicted DNA repair protein MutK
VILVPSALLHSSIVPWLIEPLMIVGDAFLCFAGCEKLAHKFLHHKTKQEHSERHKANIADTQVDPVAAEKSKVKDAARTDFILSAEIIVITLDPVATASFITQVGVLVDISMLMMAGRYGMAAGIAKLGHDIVRRGFDLPKVHMIPPMRAIAVVVPLHS